MARGVAIATIALVVIGTLETQESARQLAELGPRTVLAPAGAGFTALGTAASIVVYLALGAWIGSDTHALRAGAITGALAGLAGGSVRASLIAGAIRDIVARYAAVPDWYVPLTLAVYVVVAVIVGSAAGAALSFAGVRVARAAGRGKGAR